MKAGAQWIWNWLGVIYILHLEDNANDKLVAEAMPFTDAPAITSLLRKVPPGIKIIVTGDPHGPTGKIGGGLITKGFLPKPFTTEKLLTIIRRSLVIRIELTYVAKGS